MTWTYSTRSVAPMIGIAYKLEGVWDHQEATMLWPTTMESDSVHTTVITIRSRVRVSTVRHRGKVDGGTAPVALSQVLF